MSSDEIVLQVIKAMSLATQEYHMIETLIKCGYMEYTQSATGVVANGSGGTSVQFADTIRYTKVGWALASKLNEPIGRFLAVAEIRKRVEEVLQGESNE